MTEHEAFRETFWVEVVYPQQIALTKLPSLGA
ncbi:MAG: hypothetical protein RLZZ597_2184 [Cyanobacteriota bacterium]|jgi:hypothetical protein